MAENEKKVVKTESKPAKLKKEKKKGRVKEAWKGFKSEVKKIVWPSGKQVLKNTLVRINILLIHINILMKPICNSTKTFSIRPWQYRNQSPVKHRHPIINLIQSAVRTDIKMSIHCLLIEVFPFRG